MSFREKDLKSRGDGRPPAPGTATNGHVEHLVRAALDGELPAEELERVRAHCRACPHCRGVWAQMRALCEMLTPDDVGSTPSLWPAVAAEVARRRAQGGRPFGFSFAMGAAAAAAAGLLLGIWAGPAAWRASSSQTTEQTEAAWTEMGSLVTGEGATTLDVIYLAAVPEEGETR